MTMIQTKATHHARAGVVRVNLNKAIRLIVKYLPVIVNVWIFFILTNTVSDKYYPFLGHSIAFDILLYLLSIKYKFCSWHRALIVSMGFCVFIEFLNNEKYIVLTNVSDFQLSIVIIGLFASIVLFVYGGRKK